MTQKAQRFSALLEEGHEPMAAALAAGYSQSRAHAYLNTRSSELAKILRERFPDDTQSPWAVRRKVAGGAAGASAGALSGTPGRATAGLAFGGTQGDELRADALKAQFRELLTAISLGEIEGAKGGAPSLKDRLSAFEQLLRLEGQGGSGDAENKQIIVNFGIPRPQSQDEKLLGSRS